MKKLSSSSLPLESDFEDAGLQTLAVRAGQHRSQFNEHAEAIYPTSSFVFASAEEAAARFSGDDDGNVYSRYTNPTVQMFEERLETLRTKQEDTALDITTVGGEVKATLL